MKDNLNEVIESFYLSKIIMHYYVDLETARNMLADALEKSIDEIHDAIHRGEKMKFEHLTFTEKCNVLYNKLEKILQEYGFVQSMSREPFTYIIDSPEHKSYIYGLKYGWHCDYPKLEEIMDKYDLYSQVEFNID